jgi:PAS domain S-box-containing protein
MKTTEIPKQTVINISLRHLFSIIIFLSIAFNIDGQAEQGKKDDVLVLFPFQDVWKFQDELKSGLLKTMQLEINTGTILSFEYLDLARFSDESYLRNLANILQYKYKMIKPALVIVVSPQALDFLMRFGSEFGSLGPVIYCSSGFFEKQNQPPPNVLAIVHKPDFKGTIELALKLHPQTGHLAVIAGTTPTEQKFIAQVKKDILDFQNKLSVEWLTDLTLERMLDRVADQPEHSIILGLSFLRDSEGKSYSSLKVISEVYGRSKYPIYTTFDSALGHGVVGGRMMSYSKMGEVAGDAALRILRGEKPAHIVIPDQPSTVLMFDWRELRRWGISETSLPPKSFIEYREYSTWEKYRVMIIGITLLIILQSVFITLLLANRARKKKAQNALREEKAKLKTIFDAVQTGIVIIDPETDIIVEANPAAVKMIGAEADRIIGAACSQFICPSEQGHCPITDLNRAIENEERILLTTGGEKRDILKTVVTVIIKGRQHLLESFIDITERKRMDEELRVSEEHFRRVFEQGPIGMALSDRSSHFVQMNDSFCEMLGYSREELQQLTFKDITHPDHLTTDIEPIGKLSRGEIDIYKTEKRYIKKDKTVVWGALAVSALRDIHGELNPFLIMIENITERKTAEQAVNAANERFRSVLRAAIAYAIIGTDTNGIIKIFNGGAEMMLGYMSAEVIDKVTPELFHDPAEMRVRAQELGIKPGFEIFIPTARSGKTETREWTYIRKDGSRLIVSLTVTAMRNRDGSLEGFIGIARDITGEKELEQQLLQSQKLESLGLLAGGVAHDFNNLLTPILGYIDILENDFPENDQHFVQLQYMRRAAERARDLTQRLLAFSRKQVIELKTVDLADIIRRNESILKRMIRENIRIELNIPASLGPILADAGQIEQILINLSINAQDAMPEGGVLTIEAANAILDESYSAAHPETPAGHYVMLAVSDSGAGIDEKIIDHIFDPFFTTKERGKGTGLGLSTVYGIVKQHGVSITVHSEKNKGSIFRIYFPEASPEKKNIEQRSAVGNTAANRGEQILVVEDNEIVRALACDMLNKIGYRVLATENVDQCLEIMKEKGNSITMLLSDVIMPGMNGKALYDRLRQNWPNLKVLYMSGHAGEIIGKNGIIDERMPFIQKPFSLQLLETKIREVLDS